MAPLFVGCNLLLYLVGRGIGGGWFILAVAGVGLLARIAVKILCDQPWRRDPYWLAKTNRGVQVGFLFVTLSWAGFNLFPKEFSAFCLCVSASAMFCVWVLVKLSERDRLTGILVGPAEASLPSG